MQNRYLKSDEMDIKEVILIMSYDSLKYVAIKSFFYNFIRNQASDSNDRKNKQKNT